MLDNIKLFRYLLINLESEFSIDLIELNENFVHFKCYDNFTDVLYIFKLIYDSEILQWESSTLNETEIEKTRNKILNYAEEIFAEDSKYRQIINN